MHMARSIISSSPSSLTVVLLISIFFFLAYSPSAAKAAVPASAQFKYVINPEDFGPYIVEYDGSYQPLEPFGAPFQLCFYNTTPNAFTLAVRMGLTRSESLFRWVWEANRGNPVRVNASLTLGADGNLVLADADGRIAWQTGTANKGVVGLQLLSNGNMVLHDSRGNFLWQSFDSPTDTLLVGQSLRAGGVTRLVSRASAEHNSNGPYSLVMESKGLALYYTSKNSPKPLLYFNGWRIPSLPGSLTRVTFTVTAVDDGYAYDLGLDYETGNVTQVNSIFLGRPKYNATSSLLRLGLDGNLRVYTYNDKVDYGAWEQTVTLFDRQLGSESECQLPGRCGSLGICEDNQCVGCPLPGGIAGWSKSCAQPKVGSCRAGEFGYYKVEGVDHFLSKYTAGSAVAERECEARCSKDCKCKGYFYNRVTSRCWIAYELMTLTKVANSTHLGYIKAPKK